MDNALLIKILRKNNRLIIPSFGAFLVKESPQGANYVFSPFLKRDDGVLKEELMREFNIEPQDTQNMIEEYISHIQENIKSYGRYHIEGIGTLKADSNGALLLHAEPIISNNNQDALSSKLQQVGLPDMNIPTDLKHPVSTESMPASVNTVTEQTVMSQAPEAIPTMAAIQGTAFTQPVNNSQARVYDVVNEPTAAISAKTIAADRTPASPQAPTRPMGNVSSEARRAVSPTPIHGVSPTPVSRPIPSALTPTSGTNPVRPVVTPRPASGHVTSQHHGLGGSIAGAPQRSTSTNARPIASSEATPTSGGAHRRTAPGPMPGRRTAPGARASKGNASSKTDVWLIAAIVAAVVVLGLMVYGFFVSNPTIDVEPMIEADTTIVITE